MRYWVFDEDGLLIRKFFSKAECEPYLKSGCTVKVMPKTKPIDPHLLVGDAPF